MSTRRPIHPSRGLSLLVTIAVDPEPDKVYAEALDSVRLAEELGFETIWTAEGHFNLLGLPSALTFLAAASQVSSTIRLGTAIVPLAFDDPVRVVETAALLDSLSGARVELGVGKGNPAGLSTLTFTAFGLSEENRETLYADALAGLREAVVDGVRVGETRVPVHPPAAGLASRLWQATGNPTTAAAVGRAGDGLLLFRSIPQGDPGQVQSALIDVYLAALPAGVAPRIGTSRAVLPAGSRAEAVELLAEEIARRPHQFVTRSGPPTSAEEYLRTTNIKYGTPDDVVAQLVADPAFMRATDHLFTVPLSGGSPHFREGLRLVAEEIHPRVLQAMPETASA